MIGDAASNLGAARAQMGLSLGWHIIFACLGVGFPALILIAEWRGIRGDADAMRLARTWAKVAGVLFAVGAVSGTILSFEMGLLWPRLMGEFGSVFGLPFALEGFAFFIEAIFLGIYLHAWDRLTPMRHLASGIPVAIAGDRVRLLRGHRQLVDERSAGIHARRTDASLIRSHSSRCSTARRPVETVHMILAAFMVTGFLVASVYAAARLRGRNDRYHRLGMLLPLIVATVITPAQIVVGDIAAREVADNQPIKLAAMEGLAHTEIGAGEHIGGIFINGQLRSRSSCPTCSPFSPRAMRTRRSSGSTASRPLTDPRRSRSSICPSTSWSVSVFCFSGLVSGC